MEPSTGKPGSSGKSGFEITGRRPMPRSIEDIAAEALELPPQDRAKIARTLLASLHGAQTEDEAWEREIVRREREIDAGTVALIPAAEVFDELDTLLQ